MSFINYMINKLSVMHICLFRYKLLSALELEALAIPMEEELEKERVKREEDQVEVHEET